MNCDKCGRELVGLYCRCENTWRCCDCEEDKTDVLHCETDCKVVVKKLTAGYDCEQEGARNLFCVGDIFTVKNIIVSGSSSDVELEEFPQKKFNTVFFERLD